MTAEVEFDVDRRLDVLAVPTEAVAVEDGRDICYVAGADGLERRPVTLGRSTRDLLEVTGGLAEGEQVVLNPSKIEALDSLVVNSGRRGRAAEVARPARPSRPGAVADLGGVIRAGRPVGDRRDRDPDPRPADGRPRFR